jgi:serine/threonine protein kinase
MSVILGKYKNKKRLGKGAYGDVLLVEDPNGQEFAIKMISKRSLNKEPFLQEYLDGEKDCMMSVKSKYIMELIKV